MLLRKLILVLALTILLVGGQTKIGSTGQDQVTGKAASGVTEILKVMGKGADHIVVGEERLFVVPKITKITSSYGTPIDFGRLRTPCLAEVTYARSLQGVEKQPVVLHLRVKKLYRGASRENSGE